MSGEATPFPQDSADAAPEVVNAPSQAGEIASAPEVETAAAEPEQRVRELETQLDALRSEHDSLRSQYMRIAADFDNFRKRQSRDQEDLRVQIACSTLGEILPVVDNFERARQQLEPEAEEAQTIHRSYQGLYKQLVDVFKQMGVSPMRVEGEPFDPNLHEAVLREPSDEHVEDMVIAELQRGYHLNGRVLRHALVKVSMGPGPAGEAAADAAAAPQADAPEA
ncbi:MAG: nucleotide exchange factor GrpE [Vulcanococcus sp.]